MARVKLSEFRAKSLLTHDYRGVQIRLGSLDRDIANLDDAVSYVIKVDQGVKKRGKQGLLQLNVTKKDAKTVVESLSKRGFDRFIAEPMLSHPENSEHYVSFERTRDGILLSYSPCGGIDIEDNADSVSTYLLNADSSQELPLASDFIEHIVDIMNAEHMSFLEINPLVIDGQAYHLLDAAVMVDSAASWQVTWQDSDIVEAQQTIDSEAIISKLNDNSSAAFSFKILNPDGAIWLLLSGGGASITIADEASNLGKADLIGNYGEYSGGPTTEETYLYTKAVLEQSLASSAPRLAIIIAGGVANFTDVKKTFTGVIQALDERKDELQKRSTHVFVRRGGPNEKEGLAMMKTFLTNHELLGSVHGSDAVLTEVINEAVEYIDA